MSKGNISTGDQPLRETEDAAYNAFREWHVFLVLRKKELEAHHAPTAIEDEAAEAPIQTLSPAMKHVRSAQPARSPPQGVQSAINPPTPAPAIHVTPQLPLTRPPSSPSPPPP